MKKNIYETVIIFKVGKYKDNVTRYKDFLQKYSDEKRVAVRDVGEKKLVRPITEIHTRGYYAMFTWHGTGEDVDEFERQLRIDDEVLQFMTVKLNDTDDGSELEDYVPAEAESEQPLRITQDAWNEIFGEI